MNKLLYSQLEKLSHFIENNMALYFPENRWNDLERNIISASEKFGFDNADLFIDHISSSPLSRKNIELLASYLTINETYFWREPQTFEALEQNILLDIKERKKDSYKSLRIWSAGCSGGEEPYSIAIALKRFLPDVLDWDINIMATDISPIMLNKAERGVYNNWSFRGTPSWIKQFYFKEVEKGKFKISDEIKRMVNFSYLNLADGNYPSIVNNTNALDIIYCRNVLMYFNNKRFKEIAKKLYNSLIDGGFLVVSSSELSSSNFPDFEIVNVPGFVLYRKTIAERPVIFDIPTFDHISEAEIIDKITDDVEFETSVFEEIPPLEKKREKKTVVSEEEIQKRFVSGHYKDVIDLYAESNGHISDKSLLIKSHANIGQVDTAIKICDESLKTEKLNYRLYFLHANLLTDIGNPEKAIDALKKALYINQEFTLAYYFLANIMIKRGNVDKALKNYHNALELLSNYDNDEIVPESEGISAGRLTEFINSSILKHSKP